MRFLLYGANGYTGELIAEAASGFGLEPVLAGRSKDKIRSMAEAYRFEYRVFDLDDSRAMDEALEEVPVVVHAAGPFAHTARPMMEGCLRTRTHYQDITGELDVFEMAHGLDRKAQKAGIMILPGTGLDVVPTDCLALFLKEKLPDAVQLKLAFSALGGGVSHGTAITMAENLGKPGAVRENGKIVEVPIGHKIRIVDFGNKKRFTMTVPWGDVSTAFYTTGIPNIEVYAGIPPSAYRFVQLQRYFSWLLRKEFVRNLVKKQIDRRPGCGSAARKPKSGLGRSTECERTPRAGSPIGTGRLYADRSYDSPYRREGNPGRGADRLSDSRQRIWGRSDPGSRRSGAHPGAVILLTDHSFD